MSLIEQQKGMTDLLPSNDQCGCEYPLYSFGQTEKEVNVVVPLEDGTPAKVIRVDIGMSTLQVQVKDQCILSGELYKSIKVSESTWFLQDRKELVVVLAKSNLNGEEWWPLVVLGERQLDMKTLSPPAMNLSELDSGAQATVARMMAEQHEKRSRNLTL